MFDDLLDIFDRDRKHTGKRKGGLRGLLQRLTDHDDDRSYRERDRDRDDRDRDDDRYDDRRGGDRTHRRRRDDMDWDD